MSEFGFGADGAGVGEIFTAQVVGVIPEDIALTCCGAGLGFDTEEDGDVLVGVEAVSDEKGDHDNVWELGEGVPLGDEWGLLHVGVQHLAKDSKRTDFFDFALCCEGGVVVQVCAVSDDEEAGLV